MPSRFDFPPEECCRGTKPSQAASCRPPSKFFASPMEATSALAYDQQVRLSSRGMLPGHQAHPRRQLSAAVEVLRIPDGGDQCARRDGADAGHLREPGAEIAASMPCLDLCLQ